MHDLKTRPAPSPELSGMFVVGTVGFDAYLALVAVPNSYLKAPPLPKVKSPLVNEERGCRGYVRPSSKKNPTVTADDFHRLFKLKHLRFSKHRAKGWIP